MVLLDAAGNPQTVRPNNAPRLSATSDGTDARPPTADIRLWLRFNISSRVLSNGDVVSLSQVDVINDRPEPGRPRKPAGAYYALRPAVLVVNSPPEVVQIHLTDDVALQTQLNEPVHLLKAVHTVDAVAISSQLPQMSKTIQLWKE